MASSAPISSKARTVTHLQDQDTAQDIAARLDSFKSFCTWDRAGLRGRARQDYFKGFRFTNPGQLPEPYRQLFLDHAALNEYTVFVGSTPVAWYHGTLGWVSPTLGGFTDQRSRNEYERAHNAVLTITGKGAYQ